MKIKLYVMQGCPYCAKVLRAFDEMGLEFESMDADYGSEGSDFIYELTGRRTTPFLVVEKEGEERFYMHESDDIIAYAQEHLVSN